MGQHIYGYLEICSYWVVLNTRGLEQLYTGIPMLNNVAGWDDAFPSSTNLSVQVLIRELMIESDCEHHTIEFVRYAQHMPKFLNRQTNMLLENQGVSSRKCQMVVLKGSFDGFAALQLLYIYNNYNYNYYASIKSSSEQL